MNTRKLLVSILMLGCVLLSACTPAATPPAPTAVPPTVIPPTIAPTVTPAQDQTTFSSKKFEIPMSVSLGSQWRVDDDYSDVVTFGYKGHDAGVSFINVKNAKIGDGMAFPDDFVTWIQSPDSLFQVVDSKPVLVGGFKGTQINATYACGNKKNWIMLSGTGWGCANGERIGFIYLDDFYGERVLIQIIPSPDGKDYEFIVEESQKVLDTVVFSKSAATVPSEPPLLVEYELPTVASEPGGIVAGPDGALWFVETAVNKIGRISTDGVITEYPVPTAKAIDTDQGFLVVGPDGALWFNEDLVNQIGRITTSGQVTEFKLPDEFKPTQEQDSPIRAFVSGPDGALWVTSSAANAIIKLTMDGKIAAKYALPKAGSGPVGMVVGPDGALWFVEKSANQIGRITLDGKLSEYALPDNNSSALRITLGPDKAMWFTMIGVNKIGRISTDGAITTFDVADMGPVGITAGADNALWFTGYNSTEIGRMTTDGVLTKIQIPTTASVPYHITSGSDGNLWFTEQQGNKIGLIQLSAPTTAQNGTTFSPKPFDIPFTLVHGPDWKIDAQQSNMISFTYKDYDGSFSFIDSKSTRIAGPAAPYSVIPFPDDFVSWIQAHGLFDVVKTQSVVVGGLPGVQIDADATPACERTGWFFTASGGWNCGLGDHYRFIFMDDVHGEQFLIMTQGFMSSEDFALMTDASQKILDTVVFSKP